MIKYEFIVSYVGESTNLVMHHNKRVKEIIENISKEGNTFISCHTVPFGQNNCNFNTEIIYRENVTRNVIFEKTS